MIIQTCLIILGFILLIKGADLLVDGSSLIAKKLHISEIIIGLTIVSIGTSMPELFVSVESSIKGYQDMAIGNVIGSNICNLLLILGLSTVIFPIAFKKQTKFIEIPMCLIITIIFMVLYNVGGGISRTDAIILITLFMAFIGYTIYMGKKGTQEPILELETYNKKSTIIYIIYIILGIIGLKFGGDFIVENSKILAEYFNISEKVISLTIIAIGTSLPELVTSVTAAIKKDADIAIGNIIGSNIFNILLIIGVSGIIRPINCSSSYNVQMAILILATFILALFPYTDKKNEMSRINGIVYLILYVIYMVLLFVM